MWRMARRTATAGRWPGRRDTLLDRHRYAISCKADLHMRHRRDLLRRRTLRGIRRGVEGNFSADRKRAQRREIEIDGVRHG